MSDPLTYPFTAPPADAATLEVAPGVFWLRLPLPFALDHINVWLLDDRDGWTLVDTGVGLAEGRDLWRGLFETALGGRPLRRIIVTHYHPDHIGQAAWLAERFDAPVHITETEMATASELVAMPENEAGERLADLFERHGLDAERAGRLRTRGNTYHRLVPAVPEQHSRLSEGDEIDIGARRWRIIIGRGHAPEHACLFSEGPGQPLLISGDQVLPRISSNISVHPGAEDQDPLGDFLASLRRLSDLPEETRVLPSHGWVFEGLRQRCERLATHHERHLDNLRAECSAPRSAADILPVLFRRTLDAHQITFAMGEAIAHLLHLERHGDVQRVAGEVVRFVRSPAC